MSKEGDYIEIDPKKIRDLVDGKIKAESQEEDVAVLAYERAMQGDLLIYVITDFIISYDEMSEIERGYFLVGYSFGQLDHQELDVDRFKEGNSTLH